MAKSPIDDIDLLLQMLLEQAEESEGELVSGDVPPF